MSLIACPDCHGTSWTHVDIQQLADSDGERIPGMNDAYNPPAIAQAIRAGTGQPFRAVSVTTHTFYTCYDCGYPHRKARA